MHYCPSKPASERERTASGPLDATTCSPSLHPETDAIWEQNRDSRDPAKIEGDLLAHAEKLEQERDEARRAAIRWQDAWTNETTLHEMGSTLMPWWRDWKKSEENAHVDAQIPAPTKPESITD